MDITNEVLQLANKYLTKVRRSGNENIMAVCPFHVKLDGSQEKHPSFAMSLTKGVYFCHSCGEKGNLVTFLKGFGFSSGDIERRYKLLIEAAARNLPQPLDPLNPKLVSLNPLPESLLGIFDYCPTDLLKAGFTEDTLKRFEVGFDKQHMKITFPVRDLKGQLVAISGRSVNDFSWPKYKIYEKEYTNWGLPERVGWDKRTVLYNAHTVFPSCYFMTQNPEVIVVEGFKACMWVHQSGMPNVTGLMGNYCSREHKWILEHMGGTVYLFLDNNFAGISGTMKAGLELSRSLPVRVMNYPERLIEEEGAQPDSLSIEELFLAKEQAEDYFLWSLRLRGKVVDNGIRQGPE